MIFDNDKVMMLVAEWKRLDGDVSILSCIQEASRDLVRAIAATYESSYEDDLVQESMLTLEKVALRFNPNISKNLYGYITRAVHNTCITYIYKNTKEVMLPNDYEIEECVPEYISDNDALEEVILRNRERFPSLFCVIDDMTEYVYYALSDGTKGGTVKNLINVWGVSRSLATVVYHSTIVYLRSQLYRRVRLFPNNRDIEFTLLPDLKNMLDDIVYNDMAMLFSGMYLKFP